jgi:hypothetical protein
MKKIHLVGFNYTWLLALTFPVALVTLIVFRYAPAISFGILAGVTLIYLVGAIWHHFQDKTLTVEIIIEYILIAALALLILQGLITR